MREIKFRAWNKRTKVMVDLHKITPLALDANLHQDGVFVPFDEGVILMQYTGLKDKNGKEIYEGDVVDDGRGKAVIYYRAPTFVGVIEDGMCFALGAGMCFPDNSQLAETAIIGNIYENPDLLRESGVVA